MRRVLLFLSLLLIFPFFFSGCTEEANLLPGAVFSVKGSFRNEEGITVRAVFTRSVGRDTVAFLAPESLAGITAVAENTAEGPVYSLRYENMTLPVGERGAGFFRAFSLLSLSPGEVRKEGDRYLFTAPEGEGEILLFPDGTFRSVRLKTEKGELFFESEGEG